MELVQIKWNIPVTRASVIAEKFKRKKRDILGFINRAGFSEEFYNKNFFIIEKANEETNEVNFDYYVAYDGFTAITAAISGTVADKARREIKNAFDKYPVMDEASKLNFLTKNIDQLEIFIKNIKDEIKNI